MERKMGIASLILGVFSFILGMIPVFGCCMTAPAAIGLVLGLVEFNRAQKQKLPCGIPLTGAILSGIALLIIFLIFFVTVCIGALMEE